MPESLKLERWRCLRCGRITKLVGPPDKCAKCGGDTFRRVEDSK